jgi:hypothetical protein
MGYAVTNDVKLATLELTTLEANWLSILLEQNHCAMNSHSVASDWKKQTSTPDYLES